MHVVPLSGDVGRVIQPHVRENRTFSVNAYSQCLMVAVQNHTVIFSFESHVELAAD
eukprot:SAG31_NODE_928_length_10927_cov_4.616273_6_plen_56_part_00